MGRSILLGVLAALGVECGAPTPALAERAAPQAASFELKTLNGGELRIEDLRGKFVLLHFWATWCEPCVKEMPALQRLSRALKGLPFEVVGIAADNRDATRKWVASHGIAFPVAIDQYGGVIRDYGVKTFPTSFLVGPDGEILERIDGPRDWDRTGERDKLRILIEKRRGTKS